MFIYKSKTSNKTNWGKNFNGLPFEAQIVYKKITKKVKKINKSAKIIFNINWDFFNSKQNEKLLIHK